MEAGGGTKDFIVSPIINKGRAILRKSSIFIPRNGGTLFEIVLVFLILGNVVRQTIYTNLRLFVSFSKKGGDEEKAQFTLR